MRLVDGDELTGTCYVGNDSLPALLTFVILPSATYLFIGVCFLLSGLACVISSSRSKTASSLRIRHDSHHSSDSSRQSSHPQLLGKAAFASSCCNGANDDSKQDVLNLRVLFFAVFYILPASCILGANIYEYTYREQWYRLGSPERPNVEVFIFKIFMSLLIGMKSGLWVWSSRTPWSLWKKMALRLKKQPMPAYLQAGAGGSFLPPQQAKSSIIVNGSSCFGTLEKRPPNGTIGRASCNYNQAAPPPKSVSGGETTV
jgi:hypothetical protein